MSFARALAGQGAGQVAGKVPAGSPAQALTATAGGALRFLPGSAHPIQGGRPVLSGQALQVLTHGVPAQAYAERMALLFGLCGTAHRITARRAVQAAQADRPRAPQADAQTSVEDELLALWTAREHLHRLALDLPQRLPVEGIAADASWLRGHPLEVLPADARAADGPVRPGARAALRAWLEAQVLGGSAADWLQAWQQDNAALGATQAPQHGALYAWSDGRPQAAQRWLRGAAEAGSHALPCRALPATQCEPDALRRLAQRLLTDPGYAQRPTWDDLPAETGCWTRFARPAHTPHPHNAWMRWQSRLAELVALSADGGPQVLASGASALGDGVGVAWTEMSRGLLVHVVRLRQAGHGMVVDQGRVLAPTEWNFHPAGSLACALADPACSPAAARAAVAALDPCVETHFGAPECAPCHA